MRIGVFTLVYRDVSYATFCGMTGLAALARGPLRHGDPDFPAMNVQFEYFFRRGFSAPHNARKLMEVALDWPEPIDLALFAEADMAFYPRHVARAFATWTSLRLAAAPDAKPPIVGALYPPSGQRDGLVGGPTAISNPGPDLARAVDTGVVAPADFLGFGFVLVPMELFRARVGSGLPLFPETVGERYEGPDVLLCRYARENGYPIYADYGLDVGHMYAEPRTLKETIR